MTILETFIKLRDDLKLWVTNNLNTKANKDHTHDVIGNAVGQESITIMDSVSAPLQSLRIFGKTVQGEDPSPDAPQALVSVGDGGSVGLTLAGKNLCNAKAVVNGVYNTSVNVSDDGYTIISVGGSKAWANADIVVDITALRGKTVYLKIDSAECTQQYPSGILPIAHTTSGTVYLDSVQKSRPKSTFVIPENTTKLTLRISTNNAGTTHEVDNTMTIKGLMLSVGDYADWEPYKPAQILTASTPNGLPGIPVASGGNYTDEHGQMWICDEMDYGRGVYVQRVHTEIYDGSADEKWENNDGQKVWFIMTRYMHYKPIGSSAAYCTHFTRGSTAYGDTYSIGGDWGPMFYLKDYTTNEADFRALLASSPVKLQYILETPIERPLDAETVLAYAALHTNKPATTVLNDAGAHMEIEYRKSIYSVPVSYPETHAGKVLGINEDGFVVPMDGVSEDVKQIADAVTKIVDGTTTVAKATTAGSATKATQDGNGNNIVDTYATKSALNGKQATITGGASTITSSNLTTNRALVSDGSGKVAVSAVTSTELGYLDGVTAPIQTQINEKVPTSRTVNGKALSSNIALSASDVGALSDAGGTLGGRLNISTSSNPSIYFQDGDGYNAVRLYPYVSAEDDNNNNHRLVIAEYDVENTGYYERYFFPIPNVNMTANKSYEVLTSKSAVTVSQGGTGATNGADGLKNLFAAGKTVLSSNQYGTTLPAAGNAGRIFFKKV